MQKKETLESENRFYEPDIGSLMGDIRIAQKRNRLAIILSAISLAINFFRIIVTMIGSMA